MLGIDISWCAQKQVDMKRIKNIVLCALTLLLFSCSNKSDNNQKVFPFYPPKDKSSMELSTAMQRYYDTYNGQRPEKNELYSQFRYTELKGFDYNG